MISTTFRNECWLFGYVGLVCDDRSLLLCIRLKVHLLLCALCRDLAETTRYHFRDKHRNKRGAYFFFSFS